MTGTFVFSSDWDWKTLFFESFLIDTGMSHEVQNLEPLSNLRNTRKLGPKSHFTKIQSLWPHSLYVLQPKKIWVLWFLYGYYKKPNQLESRIVLMEHWEISVIWIAYIWARCCGHSEVRGKPDWFTTVNSRPTKAM